MNDTTIDKLEFGEIREVIARLCSTAIGKKNAASMTPTTKSKLVKQWLTQVREMIDVVDVHGYPPFGGVQDIRPSVRASSFPTPLEADALCDIASTLLSTGPIFRWMEKVADEVPSLSGLAERIMDLTFLADVINESIDPRGEVRDYASPRLAQIRKGIDQTRDRIHIVVER
ncbi:MAG: hypothetical protein ACPGXK_16025, partial [Phycisphaerae bacterium]